MTDTSPSWARRWLIAAGIYNLAWGLTIVLVPHALFDLLDVERMRYPQIWQCVGMIVGVYGVGMLFLPSWLKPAKLNKLVATLFEYTHAGQVEPPF